MNRIALAALFALAAGVRLAWAWGELESLLRYATSDDAYYYFQIAHQIVSGGGSSLDGESATNGYHPLWLLLLLPIQALTPAPETGLRVGLTLGALLGGVTVVSLARAVERLGGSAVVAGLVAGVYALHPTTRLESVNGLETSLIVCLTALVTERYLAWQGEADAASPRAAACFGLLGGALMLARSDTVFLWAALLAALAFVGRGRAGLRTALIAGGVSTLGVLPWLAWNQWIFGSPLQISAVALPELLREQYVANHGDDWATLFERSRFLLGRAFGDTLPHLYLAPRGIPWLPAGLFVFLAVAVATSSRRGRASLRPLIAPVAATLFTLAWHAGVRWWTREWYFAPAGWMLFALAGVGAAEIHRRARDARNSILAMSWLGLLGFGAACVVGVSIPSRAPLWKVDSEHRVQQLEAARWLATRTAPEARVGAWNAGILSYFSDRTVVNLDGVVNAAAYAAGREGRLLDYVVERELDYVVDWQGTLPLLRCGERPDVTCAPVATIGSALPRFAGAPMRVLRIEPDEP